MIKNSNKWPVFQGLSLQKPHKNPSIWLSITTNHGQFGQAIPFDIFCKTIHRSPLTVKKWLRKGSIPDKAVEELILHKVMEFILVPGLDGFRIADGKLWDSLDRSHTAASIESSGQLKSENRRLYHLLDNASHNNEEDLPDNVIPLRKTN